MYKKISIIILTLLLMPCTNYEARALQVPSGQSRLMEVGYTSVSETETPGTTPCQSSLLPRLANPAAGPAECDFNNNYEVDFADFQLFAEGFGRRLGDIDYESRYDLDGNNIVDFSDFLLFARNFGKDTYKQWTEEEIRGFIDDLQNGDTASCENARTQLMQGDAASADILVQYLNDPSVKSDIHDIFVGMKERGVESLLLGFETEDEMLIREIQDILVEIGEPALETMLETFTTRGDIVQQRIEQALNRMGDMALDYMETALRDPLRWDSTTRIQILNSFKTSWQGRISVLDWILKNDPDYNVRITSLDVLKDAEAIEKEAIFIHTLRYDTSEAVRVHSAQILGDVGGNTAVSALINILELYQYSNDAYFSSLREEAIISLGKLGHEGALWILSTYLDKTPYTYPYAYIENAALSMSKIGGTQAVNLLLDAIEEGAYAKNYYASKALYTLKDTAIIVIRERLSQNESDPQMKLVIENLFSVDCWAATQMMRQIGECTIPTLIEMLNGPRWKKTATALFQFNQPAIIGMINALRYGKLQFGVDAGADNALEILSIFKETSPYIWEEALGQLEPDILEPLDTVQFLLEEKAYLRDNIYEEYDIRIMNNTQELYFTLLELETITRVLDSLPIDLIKLSDDHPTIGTDLTIGKEEMPQLGKYYFNKKITIRTGELTIHSARVLIHELAHYIDHMHFGLFKGVFRELYNESSHYEDYAYFYGMSNCLEDFSTTVELYFLNSAQQLLRAVSQERAGNPIYLKKILSTLDILTEKDTEIDKEYVNMYQVTDTAFKHDRLEVARDAEGNINSIDNISLEDYEGLTEVFQNRAYEFEFQPPVLINNYLYSKQREELF